MNDVDIIRLFFLRDEKALEYTNIKYNACCSSLSYAILKNSQDVEECIDDVLVEAWNTIPPFEPQNLGAYLKKLTREKSIDLWRRKRSQKRGGAIDDVPLEELADFLSNDEDVFENVGVRELSADISSFLRALPETQRNIFIRRYWYCDSINKICELFGFKESKVKMMLLRIRESLMIFLKSRGYIDGK